MQTIAKSLMELTATDLMSDNVVLLYEETSLREAAQLLLQNQVGGAPVVDISGRCIGVLSSTDFLRLAARHEGQDQPHPACLPRSCPFQVKNRIRNGTVVTACTLPPGMCSIQVKQRGQDGEDLLVCGQPHCVLADWQVVEVEKLPLDEVSRYMTPDPVTVSPSTSIRVLARMMIDAHIHRVIVTDEERCPIGVVSTTDLLAALAYCESEV